MNRFHLLAFTAVFTMATGGAHGQVSAPTAPKRPDDQLTEIVVSAQKQGDQNLLKVPVPVGVINTDQLVEREQVRLQDYANQVPGFIVAPDFAGQTNLSIRGINSGGTPTVGVMIDDVPFGSSINTFIPELDPGDLARVEVLRGPQGTLFGSDSMGGLVRFVTVAPSTYAFSGQVSAGTDDVHNGDGYGFNIRASANIPVSDTIAFRASAFRRQEAGYIYDSLTNTKGSNSARASGERVAALWQPTDTFSLTLNALSQTITNAASGEVVPSLGDLQSNFVKDGTSSQIRIQNFSAVAMLSILGFDLSSSTGYNTIRQVDNYDFSAALGGFVGSVFGVAPYVISTGPFSNDKITQELRASTSFGELVDVQLGGFYTHESTSQTVILVGVDTNTGHYTTALNGFFAYDAPFTLTEYAGFANVTYHFTRQLDVQLGGRLSHIDQVFAAFNQYGFLNTPNPTLTPQTEAHATPFTYLATPRFFITPDVMVYARAASGYRPGGTNAAAGAPPQYSPDKTYTYELGSKGAFLDKELTVDFSVYYVAWKDIQVQQRTTQDLLYNGNGGAAKSEGVELTITAKPFDAMTVTGWVDYDNAVLTSSFGNSPTYGMPGDRLPFSAKVSANISVRHVLPVVRSLTPFIAADASYTGNRIGIFQSTSARQYYPGFTQTNFQTGFNYDAWMVNAYLNNAADVRGLLNGGIGYSNPTAFQLIQPRTVGLSFTRKF